MADDSILILGCGNMGGAMLAGWLAGGLDPARVTVYDPNVDKVPPGIALVRELPGGPFDLVLLGIKPQQIDEIAPKLATAIHADTVLISILAGVELFSLAARFPQAKAIVRAMPNLTAVLGKSPVGLAAGAIDADSKVRVTALMAMLGQPQWIDEAQFDLVTALVGSGPAFVYRFIDALAQGAAAQGMDHAQASQLAAAMVAGAAALAVGSKATLGELAERVASPGGTTRAGLDVLDTALAPLVEATLRAARDRGAELARTAR